MVSREHVFPKYDHRGAVWTNGNIPRGSGWGNSPGNEEDVSSPEGRSLVFVELQLKSRPTLRNLEVNDLSLPPEALCPCVEGSFQTMRKKIGHYARAIKINQNSNLLYEDLRRLSRFPRASHFP